MATVPRNANGAGDEADEAGDSLAPVAAAARALQVPRSFYRLLPAVTAYPFRGLGWAAIVAGAVFFWLLDVLSFAPLVGWFASVFASGHLAAFMIKVVGSSAAGQADPPDWPDLTGFVDDILRPLLLLIGACVLGLGPMIALLVRRPGLWSEGQWSASPAFWAALGWAVLYLPMAIIGVALYDSFAGLNPVKVVVGIVRTLPAYLAAAAMFFLCYCVSAALRRHVSQVPVVGSVVAGAVSLYFILVEMRVLGLLYHTHARRLGWFE